MRWGVDRRCWGGPLEVSTARGSRRDPYGTNGTMEAVWDAVQGAGGLVEIFCHAEPGTGEADILGPPTQAGCHSSRRISAWSLARNHFWGAAGRPESPARAKYRLRGSRPSCH